MFAALACGAASKTDFPRGKGNNEICKRESVMQVANCEFYTKAWCNIVFCSEKNIDTSDIEDGDRDEELMVAGGVGAVHQAVLDNNLEKLEKLIEDDFPLDERDAHCLTPLHLAVSLGREDLVRG